MWLLSNILGVLGSCLGVTVQLHKVRCYAIARVFWVVLKQFLRCSIWLPSNIQCVLSGC